MLRVARGIVLILALYSIIFLGWAYFFSDLSAIQRVRSTTAAILLWISWIMLSRLLKAKAKPNLEVLVLAGIGILFTGSGVFTWVEMGTFIGDQSGVHRVPVAGIIVGLLLILSSVVAWRGRCR